MSHCEFPLSIVNPHILLSKLRLSMSIQRLLVISPRAWSKLRRSLLLLLFSIRLARALRRPLPPVIRLDHSGHDGADDEDEGEAAVGVAVLLAGGLEEPLRGHRADDAEDLAKYGSD